LGWGRASVGGKGRTAKNSGEGKKGKFVLFRRGKKRQYEIIVREGGGGRKFGMEDLVDYIREEGENQDSPLQR